jgi:uncharacterized phage-associated protein
MTRALDIARFFIFLKENDPRGLELSNLKLQKLMYYAQGYFLALYGKPLFDDPIEAWKYGPVIREVYNKYKSFGDLDIYEDDHSNYNYMELDSKKQSVIAYVWKILGEKTAGTLVDKTHSESPWLDTWFNNEKIIPETKIKSYFDKNRPENYLISY